MLQGLHGFHLLLLECTLWLHLRMNNPMLGIIGSCLMTLQLL